jgi:hypothetical protein
VTARLGAVLAGALAMTLPAGAARHLSGGVLDGVPRKGFANANRLAPERAGIVVLAETGVRLPATDDRAALAARPRALQAFLAGCTVPPAPRAELAR